MVIYCWKITASDRPDVERMTSLVELEAYINNCDLPRTQPTSEIIAQTHLWQHKRQGVYKHRVQGEEWTLVWIALGHDG